jgi:hypothetical protein
LLTRELNDPIPQRSHVMKIFLQNLGIWNNKASGGNEKLLCIFG